MTNLLQSTVESNALPVAEINQYLYCKDVPEYSRNFITYIEKIKRLSPNSVSTYSRILKTFCRYLSTVNEDVLRIRIIRKFMVTLVDKGYKATSVNLYLNALRSFHRYCLKNELIKINAANSIPQQRKPKHLPKYLSEKEVIDVLNGNFRKNFNGIRDKFIIEMLYGTGCRLNELITIKDSDINSKGWVKVMGKGSKERMIPMHSKLIELYKAYIKKKKSYLKGSTSEYLFVNKKGNQLYAMFIHRVIKKYFGHITRINMHTHLLRHTFATHLLNRGVNVVAIGQLLGHSSIASTAIYSHVEIEKIKAEYAKVFK